jgi:hypothetical protein
MTVQGHEAPGNYPAGGGFYTNILIIVFTKISTLV